MHSWYPDIKSTIVNGTRYQKMAHCSVTDRELLLCEDGVLCVYDAVKNKMYLMNGLTKIRSVFKKNEKYTLLDITSGMRWVISDAVNTGMMLNEAGDVEHKFICHVKYQDYDEFAAIWSGLCTHEVMYDFGDEIEIEMCIPDSHFARHLVKVL